MGKTNTIVFSKTTTFLGRNGEFKSTGVILTGLPSVDGDEVVIQPITSKDLIGRSYISIPKKDIPALIALLESFNK